MKPPILKAAPAFFACMSTLELPGGLARFLATQVRLWLVPDTPPARCLGPLGVVPPVEIETLHDGHAGALLLAASQ